MTLSEKLWLDEQQRDAMNAPIVRPLGHYVLTEEDDRGVLIAGAVMLALLALTFGAGLVVGSVWL